MDVYKTLRQRVMAWLLFVSIVIVIYASFAMSPFVWKMWIVLPITIFMLYLSGK